MRLFGLVIMTKSQFNDYVAERLGKAVGQGFGAGFKECLNRANTALLGSGIEFVKQRKTFVEKQIEAILMKEEERK